MKKTSFSFLSVQLQGHFYFLHLSLRGFPSVHSPQLPFSPAEGSVSSTHSPSQTTIHPTQAAFYIHVLKRGGKRNKSQIQGEGLQHVEALLPLPRLCKQAEEKRSTSAGCELSLFEWQNVSPSHEYQGRPASIIHDPAVSKVLIFTLILQNQQWLSLFNIVGAEGPAGVTLGQKVCSDVWQAGEFLNKCW